MVKSVSAYGSGFVYSTFVCHPMFEKGAGNQILDRLLRIMPHSRMSFQHG